MTCETDGQTDSRTLVYHNRSRLKDGRTKNLTIRNKNCLWWPCLLIDRDKMSKLFKGPSIDASYKVSVYLVEGFQRRRIKCEKLTDDGRQVMAKAHVSFGKVS